MTGVLGASKVGIDKGANHLVSRLQAQQIVIPFNAGYRLATGEMMSDVIPFFRAWASDPLRVASVIPSGKALSKLITSEVNAARGPVLELGPGTGVFTRALLERGIPQSRLVLVEFGTEFADILRVRFPEAHVVCMNATRLRHMYWYANQQAGAVVSGLPLLSMSAGKIMLVLSGAFSHLQEDGAFYQFTYGRRCPVPVRILDRLGLRAHSIGWAFNNFPPAQVFRITRHEISDDEVGIPTFCQLANKHT